MQKIMLELQQALLHNKAVRKSNNFYFLEIEERDIQYTL